MTFSPVHKKTYYILFVNRHLTIRCMMTGVCVTSDAPSTVTLTFIPARPAQQRGDISRYLVQPRETEGTLLCATRATHLYRFSMLVGEMEYSFANNQDFDFNHDDYIDLHRSR